MLNKRILVLMFVVAFLLLVGCGPPPTVPNRVPIITSDPIITATVGVEYTYDVNATDPDGDTLTYSLATPAGMTINSASGLIMWIPTSAQVGNNLVTVMVSDGALYITQSFTIVVSEPTAPPVNHAPTINSTPVTTATVGLTYVYDVNATDPDGDTLTYFLTTNPGGMAINPVNGLIWWTPIAKGNYAVVVNVSDGALSDTQGFTIVVSEPTVPVETYTITSSAGTGGTISPLGDITVSKGANISFTITPNTNYNIADVLVDGGSVGAVASYTFNNVAKDHTIHATFSAVEPEPEIELTKIEVDPKTMTLFEGGSQLITSVTAHYSDGSTTDIALGSCTYASSATAVATVSNGLVTAVAEGTATITVSYMSKTDTLGVTVNPVLLTSIAVLPEAMTLSVKGSGAITSVTAHYNDGSTAVVVLGDCTYLSDDEAVATVLAGVVSALTPGTATITVNCGGMTDTVEVTVSSILLTSIVVLPETMTLLSTGFETIESVTAHYSDGTEAEIALADCVYESDDTDVATVDTGEITAKGFGTATITVSYTEEEITKTIIVEETDTVGVTVGPVHNITRKTYHDTIPTAINGAVAFDVIEVAAGTYDEDVTIDKSLTLVSIEGKDDTIINGQSTGWTGAIVVIAGISDVTIGDTGKGFTVNGTGRAAISLVGSTAPNDSITIRDNKLVAANGNCALETGSLQSNHTIADNEFSGIASQLVYICGETSVAGDSTGVNFTNNTFAGAATGPALGQEANDSTISGNTFATVTSHTSLELWGANNIVIGNDFTIYLPVGGVYVLDSTGTDPWGIPGGGVFIVDLDEILINNTFLRDVVVVNNEIVVE